MCKPYIIQELLCKKKPMFQILGQPLILLSKQYVMWNHFYVIYVHVVLFLTDLFWKCPRPDLKTHWVIQPLKLVWLKSKAMLVCWLVNNFAPDCTSTSIGWISITFCTDIHHAQRMNHIDFGDHLTFPLALI